MGERPVPTPGGRQPPTAAQVVVAVSTATLAVIVAVGALSEARIIAIPTVLGCLLAVALTPAARAIERFGAPRSVAALLLVFGSVAGAGAAIYAVAPAYDTLARQMPQIEMRLEIGLRVLESEIGIGSPPSAPDDDAEDGGDAEEGESLVESGRQILTETLMATPALVGAAIYCVFLTYFLLAERDRLARWILSLARTHRVRLGLMRAMRDVRLQVSTYLFAVTLVNIALGVATALAFWAIGVPNAAIWGAAAAILNYMPYLGPVVTGGAVFAVEFLTTFSLDRAVTPVLVVVLFNIIEGYWLTPRLIGRQVQVSALAVFMAIAFGAWLWGAAGAVIATPALIFLRAFALRLAAVLGGRRRSRAWR